METSEIQTKSSSKSPTNRSSSKPKPNKSETTLQSRIEVAAYYKAQARDFTPGYELDDWLAAEKEENQ